MVAAVASAAEARRVMEVYMMLRIRVTKVVNIQVKKEWYETLPERSSRNVKVDE